MRILLSTYDSRGGVEPLVAVALHLLDAGAEVRLAAPPDCAARLAEVGVVHVPVGGSVRELVHGATRPSPAGVPQRAAELMAAQFEVLGPVARECDLVAGSGLVPTVAGAKSVAERAGIPFVMVNYCPIFVPSPHQPLHPLPGHPVPTDVTDRAALDAWSRGAYNAVFGEALNALRARAGLAVVDDVRDFVFGGRPLVAADRVLAPWEGAPDAVVQTGAWMVADERPLPDEVLAFLEAGEPPVFASFGSMRAPDGFARVAIEAIRAQGRRVLLGRGWADLSPVDGGSDCLAVGEINQQALFRRVAAVVHHGGAGTTTVATAAGVPQVVVPQIADQPFFAGRVADLGVGAAAPSSPTVGELSHALAAALAPGVRERAGAVAARIRTDGAAEGAELLLELAGGGAAGARG